MNWYQNYNLLLIKRELQNLPIMQTVFLPLQFTSLDFIYLYYLTFFIDNDLQFLKIKFDINLAFIKIFNINASFNQFYDFAKNYDFTKILFLSNFLGYKFNSYFNCYIFISYLFKNISLYKNHYNNLKNLMILNFIYLINC